VSGPVSPLKWLRSVRFFTSARSAALAFGLLLCSATLLYVGYVRWNLTWLDGIAATVVVASVTTVVIDRLIVHYRRVRLISTLESGRRQLEDSCSDLVKAVNDICEQVNQAYPEAPYWYAGGGYTPAGVDDSWRLWLERLNAAVNVWTALTGYGLRSARINAIDDSLANLRDAHTEALDTFVQLETHMKSKKTPFVLFGDPPPPPQPDEDISKATEAVAVKVTNATRKTLAAIEVLKRTAAEDDLQARVARRHPFRLPRWLQFATVLLAVTWVAVLACARLFPTAFPGGFVEDNLINITASTAIALFAGALTIALAQGRRVATGRNALSSFLVLQNICTGIIFMAVPPGHPDLRQVLAENADDIADLTAAIQNETPSAELAFWTRIVTDNMHQLAAVETPFFISEADVDDKFATLFRPTRDPDLDPDTQAHFAQQKARASTRPSGPTPQLLKLASDLMKLIGAAQAAIQGQGT
jgi:hypothetical protein